MSARVPFRARARNQAVKANGPTRQPALFSHWTANLVTEAGEERRRRGEKTKKRDGGGIAGARRRGGRRRRRSGAAAEGQVLQGLPILLVRAQVPRLQPHLRRDPPLHLPRSQTLTRRAANLQSIRPIFATQPTNYACEFVYLKEENKNSGLSYA